MKKIFIVLGTLLFQYTLIAQAPEMNFRNLHKYWEYKQRLHDKFVVIDWGGDGIGEFIDEPDQLRFEKSGYSTPAASYWQYSNQEWRMRGEGLGNIETPIEDELGQLAEDNNLADDRFGILKWGDGTIILGHYIGVLSTEYALLTQNGQNNQAALTLEELYLALQAYKRLDMTANRVEEQRAIRDGIDCTDETLQFDGFSGWFFREDAHSTMWQEFNDPEINGTVSDYSLRDRNIFHDYDHPNADFRKRLEDVLPSQDQVGHLLFGLALARTYIPENAMIRGENLRNIISDIATGLVFGESQKKRNRWGITTHGPKYPCEDRALRINKRGTEFNNYIGMLYAHNYITGEPVQLTEATNGEKLVWREQAQLYFNLLGSSFQFPPQFNPLTPLGDLALAIYGDINYNSYDDLEGNVKDNLIMYLALSAAGNPVQGVSTTDISFLHQRFNSTWSLGEFGAYIYPLAMLNMHYSNESTYRTQNTMFNRVTDLLNSAPCGGGCVPCDGSDLNGGGFCTNEYNNNPGWCQADGTEWQASHRFISSPVEYNPSNQNFETKAPGRRTNGLDYMLAYNLYHLTFINDMIPYFNTYEPENNVELQYVDDGTYPTQALIKSATGTQGGGVEITTERILPRSTEDMPRIAISESIISNAVINSNVPLCDIVQPTFSQETACQNGTLSNVNVNGGIIYKADRIILENGFRAEEGAIFIAETDVEGSVVCLPDGTFGRISSDEETVIEEELELTPSINSFVESESGSRSILDSYAFKTYPNPFSHNLTIEYQLPKRENIQISLFNTAGQEVRKIVNTTIRDAGKYQENLNSDGLTSGIYFVKMILDNKVITEKVTLMQN